MGNFIEDNGVGWIGFPKHRVAHFYMRNTTNPQYYALCRWHSFLSDREKFTLGDQGKRHCKVCEKLLKEDWNWGR